MEGGQPGRRMYTKSQLLNLTGDELRIIVDSLRLQIKEYEEILKQDNDINDSLTMQADARQIIIGQLLDLCTLGTRDLDYYFRSVKMSVAEPSSLPVTATDSD